MLPIADQDLAGLASGRLAGSGESPDPQDAPQLFAAERSDRVVGESATWGGSVYTWYVTTCNGNAARLIEKQRAAVCATHYASDKHPSNGATYL